MIAITSYVLGADKSWKLTWASTGAAFYRIVLRGEEIDQTTSLTYTWHGQNYRDFPPPLEVVSENEQALSEQFQPFLVIQWYAVAKAVHYLVEEWAGSAWSRVAQVSGDTSWVYTYQSSKTLFDVSTYNFRVLAVDSVGNKSDPQEYRKYIVCPPEPTDTHVKVGYSAGNVTVTQV